jgi:hypothetical protein
MLLPEALQRPQAVQQEIDVWDKAYLKWLEVQTTLHDKSYEFKAAQVADTKALTEPVPAGEPGPGSKATDKAQRTFCIGARWPGAREAGRTGRPKSFDNYPGPPEGSSRQVHDLGEAGSGFAEGMTAARHTVTSFSRIARKVLRVSVGWSLSRGPGCRSTPLSRWRVRPRYLRGPSRGSSKLCCCCGSFLRLKLVGPLTTRQAARTRISQTLRGREGAKLIPQSS